MYVLSWRSVYNCALFWCLFPLLLGNCGSKYPTKSSPLQSIQYTEVLMSAMASQITSLTIVCSIVYSGTDQRKHQSSASLAIVRGIHRWPVKPNSPHKGPATQKMFPFDDVIMHQRHGVSSNQQLRCLFNSLFRHTSEKTSKLRLNAH